MISMGLRSTFLLLTFLIISVLLGGVGFILNDGQDQIEEDWQRSKKDLEKSLLIVNYISKYKLISSFPLNSMKEVSSTLNDLNNSYMQIAETDELSELKLSHPKKKLDRMKVLNRSLLLSRERLNKESIVEKQTWDEIEKKLSTEIVTRMKNGQEFLPGFKTTLSKWAQDIPFFEKVRNSLDISYVQQEKFQELKELMDFSDWLISWKNFEQTRDVNLKSKFTGAFEKIKSTKLNEKLKSHLIRSFENLQSIKFQIERTLSTKESIEAEIKSIKNEVSHHLNTHLVPSWQSFREIQLDLETRERADRLRIVVTSVIIIGVFILLIMCILFLRIFPQLKVLQDRAILVGKGDFSKRIDSKIPKNEIGQVMLAFNEMSTELNEYIIKQREIEEEKIKLLDSIQRMRKVSELGEYSAKMAHELKNPLAILMYCLDDAENFLKSKDFHLAKNELEKASHALERLKVVAGKLGSRNNLSVKEEISLRAMIKDLVSMYDSMASSAEVNINLNFDNENAKYAIYASKTELLGAISNILDNAIEYIVSHKSTSKKIEVSIEQVEDSIYIKISNEGGAIEESHKIFDSLYSSKEGIGRGMGIAIAQDVAKSIGGDLLYSHSDGLNCFTFKIPRKTNSLS